MEAQDLVLVQHLVVRSTEHPLRSGELLFRLAQRLVAMTSRAVEVPPARPVGDVVQLALRSPLRLADRLARTAGDLARRRDRPVRVELPDPELGPVPWHVRVVPREPREPASFGAELWRRVEIVAAREHDRIASPVHIECDERVDSLAFPARMVLAHGEDTLAFAVDREVRMAHIPLGADGARRPCGILPVETLVIEVGEPDGAVADRVIAAAIFMDARTRIEAARCDVGNRAVPPRSGQAQLTLEEQVDRDRGRPGSEGRGVLQSRLMISAPARITLDTGSV